MYSRAATKEGGDPLLLNLGVVQPPIPATSVPNRTKSLKHSNKKSRLNYSKISFFKDFLVIKIDFGLLKTTYFIIKNLIPIMQILCVEKKDFEYLTFKKFVF